MHSEPKANCIPRSNKGSTNIRTRRLLFSSEFNGQGSGSGRIPVTLSHALKLTGRAEDKQDAVASLKSVCISKPTNRGQPPCRTMFSS
ncbi:hypothetical protein GY45DRAFT_744782 [Cubamyces sp. BRFM 1775]|nr:hypothetical protein GY45DRAFT_744782 [Cubamyces sp. BRFM 1775]